MVGATAVTVRIAELLLTLVASAILLVVGEIVPKSLFRRYPYRLCMAVADWLNATAWLFAPLVSLLGFVMRGIMRLSGGSEAPRSFFVTREEFESFSNSLDLFYVDSGRYPTTQEGLGALLERPPDAERWSAGCSWRQ